MIGGIIDMIWEFCDEHLDEEFKSLSIKLAHALADRDDILFRDDETWACGIICAIAQLNFRFEGLYSPYVTHDDLCGYFNVSRLKMNNKARDIRRLLNLKLGDEEFSTRFVLSLNIPQSDVDLKRIRIFNEVKYDISKRPESADAMDNGEVEDLMAEGSLNDLFLLLRKTYFLRPYYGSFNVTIGGEDNKFKIPLFTSKERAEGVADEFILSVWPLVNVMDYMSNDNFEGVIINPQRDDFALTPDMIREVYPEPDKYDYSKIFFLR